MPLFKLLIKAPDLEAGHAACDVLERLEPAPLAVTLFEDGPPRFIVEAYYDGQPEANAIRRLLATRDARLGAPALKELADQDWVALSQAALPPIAAGRIVVHGSHDRACFALRRLAVEIEAGEAFGSGHNATTALCLEALDALARRRRLRRVLDLGCGSGVLAIAAARVAPGARVLAVDNDPRAVAIAQENARLNRVAGRVRVLRASGFEHPVLRRAPPFDLVLANILPGPLIALTPALHQALGGGGIAVLSGLLDHQARELAATYRAANFRLVRRVQRAGWTAFTFVRR
ncbi:MAG: 50S ribosomal protein L11 methyltransferase [Hyphomicrobiaceae bacterium]|nr:50S ribosomal protein L11 methyltransferase [Hyphomicrobiaceae bacterium]